MPRLGAGFIDVVFTGPPGGQALYLETLDHRGKAVELGTWVKDEDGMWRMRFTTADVRRLVQPSMGDS